MTTGRAHHAGMLAVTRLTLLSALPVLLCIPAARAASPPESTKRLVAVLRSDASVFEKARACQQLGEIGTSDAVPVLAGLLTDPKLSAYARSGLEGIPDPSAAAALIKAAEEIKGPLLAGIVNSLGVLRDAKAVKILGRLAGDPASGVSGEALLALGNIASPASIRLLEKNLASRTEPSRTQAAAACLIAADRQRTDGDVSRAVALYDLVRNANVPIAFRVGATRGAILGRKAGRVPFLIEQLKSAELAIRNAALLTIREIPDDTLATALNAQVTRAKPELQGQLLLALADCHNAQSIAVVQALGDSPNPEIRQTALRVLGRMGPGAALALIEDLRQERPVEETSILLGALSGLEGATVDDLLLKELATSSTPRVQVHVIRLLNSRDVTQATPAILKLASASDNGVSIAALSALRSLAGPNELPALLALTRSCSDEAVKEASENALVGICSRSGEAASETVANELKRATKPSERNSWMRVLARVGYAPALPLIQTAASDPDPSVAGNALAQLGQWPNPAPMETLLKAMDSGGSPALRKQALVSAIDLAATAVDENLAPPSTVVGWLGRVTSLAQSAEDKRRVLGLLGRLKTAESFRLLAPFLDDASLRTEAAAGIIQIAPALVKGEEAGAVQAALEKIAMEVANDDLRNRASQVAKTIPASHRPVSLFDGRSLAGWEGDTNVWRVRDGVIVGGSMNGNPQNEFLATVRSYTNFMLRLEYKLVGTEGFVNSGVQFRSVRVANPPNEMNGYQADIGAGYSGCLYDESRRNKFLARPSEETIKRLEKADDWNRYAIRGEGRRIQLWLNGERTVDYTEPDAAIPQRGLIGLQIHGGNKAEVSFRNIILEEL